MEEKFNSYRPTREVPEEKMQWKEIAEGVLFGITIVLFVLLIINFA